MLINIKYTFTGMITKRKQKSYILTYLCKLGKFVIYFHKDIHVFL